jgi:hypothetical protein
MPKKLKVQDDGDELEIPQDHIIEVSYSKAKQLTKKPYTMSEKQQENIQRLVARNQEKKAERIKQKAEQEALIRAQQAQVPKQKIIVKPKRVFKKQEYPSTNDYIEQKIKQQHYDDQRPFRSPTLAEETDEEEEDDDDFETRTPTLAEVEIKPVNPKPIKPRPTKPIPIPQNPRSNSKLIEMENKLKQIEQSINKPVQNNKYSSMYSSFFGKK